MTDTTAPTPDSTSFAAGVPAPLFAIMTADEREARRILKGMSPMERHRLGDGIRRLHHVLTTTWCGECGRASNELIKDLFGGRICQDCVDEFAEDDARASRAAAARML